MTIFSIIICIASALTLAHAQQTRADSACITLKCPENFRCQDGVCLRQEKQAKKSICNSNESPKNMQAVRCTNRNYNCVATDSLPACGFTSDGQKKDFSNDCLPCLDASIDYFYRLPCTSSPSICNETQQCLNGKCVEMFNTAADSNRKICNNNSDCKQILQLCVANKCVKKTELFSTLYKTSSKAK